MTATGDKQANGTDTRSEKQEVRRLKLQEPVGLDTLPEQYVTYAIQDGFNFNILCIGETGLGKTTLMESLFNMSFDMAPCSHQQSDVTLQSKRFNLEEGKVRLKLNVVETSGYGDQINKENSFQAIVDYIDSQFESFLQEELKIRRNLDRDDTRIHACIYFICPTGHGLKAIDLVCMKKIDSKVNLIPVIAKADTVSKTELQRFKIKIMSELVSNGVQLYQFPTDDDTTAEQNAQLQSQLPFAVVGSTDFLRVGNKMMRARQYPWGVVQIDNENHCDFTRLREVLVRTNMADLIEQTHLRHYELYRRVRLEQMGFGEDGVLETESMLEEKWAQHKSQLQRREEETREVFVRRIKDKETELKEAEHQLHLRYEAYKRELADEKKKLEDNKAHLESDMNELNRKRMIVQQQATLTLGKSKKK